MRADPISEINQMAVVCKKYNSNVSLWSNQLQRLGLNKDVGYKLEHTSFYLTSRQISSDQLSWAVLGCEKIVVNSSQVSTPQSWDLPKPPSLITGLHGRPHPWSHTKCAAYRRVFDQPAVYVLRTIAIQLSLKQTDLKSSWAVVL